MTTIGPIPARTEVWAVMLSSFATPDGGWIAAVPLALRFSMAPGGCRSKAVPNPWRYGRKR